MAYELGLSDMILISVFNETFAKALPENTFFKAADYGIVGDAFDVVPKMIQAVKKLKGVS